MIDEYNLPETIKNKSPFSKPKSNTLTNPFSIPNKTGIAETKKEVSIAHKDSPILPKTPSTPGFSKQKILKPRPSIKPIVKPMGNFAVLKGTQGIKGDTGSIGPKGEQGDKGEQGLMGIMGLRGPQGLKGDIGPQGIQGEIGLQGPMGPKGDKGDIGPMGPPGPVTTNNGPDHYPLFGSSTRFKLFNQGSGTSLIRNENKHSAGIKSIAQGSNIVISDDGSGTLTIASTASGGGGTTRSINSISSNTSAGSTAATDYIYFISGTTTLTMPTAVGNTNLYTLKNTGVNTVTIAFTGVETGDGSSTLSLPVTNTSVDLISDGTNWYIV